jgi:multidrug efflux pump
MSETPDTDLVEHRAQQADAGGISRPFIERPVATTLLTLGIAIAGWIAFLGLPVAALPQIDFPVISVQASLPGASPETMAATVATPLERSLGQIAGVDEITSSSSLGQTRVTLQFDLKRDIDGAARDVQAAINAARALLPTALPSSPLWRKVNPADAPIMIISMTSTTHTMAEIYDVASTVVSQKLAQVRGVGQVTVGGGSLPAVRVELDPLKLASNHLSPEQVRAAIVSANADRPKGAIEDANHHWQLLANDQAHLAADYLPTVVSWRNGSAVRLSDVATVIDSVQDVRNGGLVNGKPAVVLILNRQPNANVVDTVARIRELLPQLRAAIPATMQLDVVLDRTPTIQASLREVERTLIIAILLVVFVTFLFLGDWRAAAVSIVVVPVSLLGTCVAMYFCGYSLDILSLMALTVATGFVVDDAVVVLENIMRHVDEGMTPVKAALRGAREVGFTVLAMSLSLIAVFIPILFMQGLIGRLFREFAVTLATAILVSLVISLTATPMLASRLLQPSTDRPKGSFASAVTRSFERVKLNYRASLEWALDHSRFVSISLLLTIVLNIALYIFIPKGFLPQQDTGRLIGNIQGDQSLSFIAMNEKLRRFVHIIQQDPAIENVVAFTGGGQKNSGFVFATLKPVASRPGVSADDVINRLRRPLMHEPGASLFLQSAQDIRAGGRSANAQFQYTLQADTLEQLKLWAPRLKNALMDLPQLADINSDQQDKGVDSLVTVDRDAASRLGITLSAVDAALYDWFGQRPVSTIYNALNQYYVVMEANPRFLTDSSALSSVYVTGANGTQVPLSAIAHFGALNTALAVNHQGQFAATTISYNLPPGTSMSQAADAIERTFAKLGIPSSVRGSFQGTAKLFQGSNDAQPYLILAAIVAMYIVLGILYESRLLPVTILSTLPSAGVGALLALLALKVDFTLIALIGVILLIGIVKKNAIMMIDVAIALEREHGLDPKQAILRACTQRFRPIVMTTMAALAGAIPLAFGHGDGAELRQPLGITILGGLILSQLLTLYTTPVIYLYLDRIRLRWKSREPLAPHANQLEPL